MACDRRSFLGTAGVTLAALLAGCGRPEPQPEEPSAPEPSKPSVDVHAFDALALDNGAWSYDKDHDVYYQLSVPYCVDPAAEAYQKLSIFVPGAYFSADKNGETFSCTIKKDGAKGAFTAQTAPVLFPVNCPEYAAQAPETGYSYEGLKPYLEKGCVYVFAGCRGRSSGYDPNSSGDGFFAGGMPWNLADLKAAIRYLRFNAARIPGDTGNVVALGLGAGGALAVALGVTGNAPVFEPYLKQTGAALWDADGRDLSDALGSVAVWCPQVSLPTMDASYEWLYGQYADEGTRAEGQWTKALSNDLAAAWADTLNGLGLSTHDDRALTLDQTSGGIFTGGSFYEELLSAVQSSVETFFANTSFPATLTVQDLAGAVFPGGSADAAALAELEAGAQQAASQASADPAPVAPSTPAPESRSFETAEAYVNELNAAGRWITYSQEASRVRVSNLEGYVKSCAPAKLPCTAFDGLACKTPQNQVFGVRDKSTEHFSPMIWDIMNANLFRYSDLAGYEGAYVGAWAVDLRDKNSLGRSVQARAEDTDPLSYLCEGKKWHGKGAVAPRWRVNVGLSQSKAPLASVYALASALGAYQGVQTVAFTPVWGKGHELAELTGDAAANVADWLAGFVEAAPATDQTKE